MAKKSAQAIVDDLTAVGEDIRQRAVEETREYVARAVEEMFLGGPNVGRRQFDHRSPHDCIYEYLQDHETLQAEPSLKAALERFEDSYVTDDFRAGILFACKLFADPDFEY